MSRNIKKKVEEIIEDSCENCGSVVCVCKSEPTIKEKINEFIKTMAGKTRMTIEEQTIMYNLYNEAYGRNEKTIGCDLCAIRIYQAIKNY